MASQKIERRACVINVLPQLRLKLPRLESLIIAELPMRVDNSVRTPAFWRWELLPLNHVVSFNHRLGVLHIACTPGSRGENRHFRTGILQA